MPRNKEVMVITTPAVAGQPEIGELHDVVGFHIRLAHGAVYRHFCETFSTLGLTQKQVTALWLVDDHPSLAQTDLAQLMRIDRATTMAIVNHLEARGFLQRGKSPTDARKQTLNLTVPGRRALKKAKVAIYKHESWLKSRFTADEVRLLVQMLARIHE